MNFVTYGIGNGVNSTQLKDWASGPSNEKLFYSASFKDPNPSALIKKLGKEFCESKCKVFNVAISKRKRSS